MIYNKILPVLFLIVSIFFSINISAQEQTKRLNLDDVIKIAQEQSPDALVAKHRFRSSYWKYRSFKASFLPFLNLNASFPNVTVTFGLTNVFVEAVYPLLIKVGGIEPVIRLVDFETILPIRLKKLFEYAANSKKQEIEKSNYFNKEKDKVITEYIGKGEEKLTGTST